MATPNASGKIGKQFGRYRVNRIGHGLSAGRVMLRHHMIEPLADVRFSDVNEFPPICRRPMTLVPVNLSPEKVEYRRLNFLNETLALIHGTLRLVVCRLVKARAIPLIGV